MNLISTEERIDLLKNLLADPDDWISAEILRLAEEDGDVLVRAGTRTNDPASTKMK